jgi:hypothetical protein
MLSAVKMCKLLPTIFYRRKKSSTGILTIFPRLLVYKNSRVPSPPSLRYYVYRKIDKELGKLSEEF